MDESVVCKACGVVNPDWVELVDTLDAVKDENAKKARRIRQLETDQSNKLELSSHYGEAKEVLTHWQQVCAPKAREPLTRKRLEPVIERLKGRYTVLELKAAANGYGRFPYLTRGRRSHFGQEMDRYCDAEFIYKTPQNVDRGIAMARAPDNGQPHPAFAARVPWDKVWQENRRLIVAALKRTFGEGLVGYNGLTEWPCPFCQKKHPEPEGQETLGLTVRNEPGQRIVECWQCGCNDARMLAAITDVL